MSTKPAPNGAIRPTLNTVEERTEYIMQCQRETDNARAEVARINQEQAEFSRLIEVYTQLVAMSYGQTIAYLMFSPVIEGDV